MDYSKAFELLNQNAEKERNKKAEKAVHDNLYNKGFRDGLAVLDKIRAEMEQIKEAEYQIYGKGSWRFVDKCLDVIDKYKGESEKTK